MATTSRPTQRAIAEPEVAAKQSRDRIARVVRVVQERWERRDLKPAPPSRQKLVRRKPDKD